MEKSVSEAIKFRRSVRKFDTKADLDTNKVKNVLKMEY